jgi:ATP-dependent Clp protease ATP-binding subunit ClpC
VFERFTDGSRRAVVLAQESAADLQHDRITVGHLLLGVARAEQGAGFAALEDEGVTPERLRQAMRGVVPSGGPVSAGHVPFTRAAKQAMEYSLQEALGHGAEMIDNGHILLALLRRSGDQLPSVLAAAGIDGSALRPAVERRLAELVPEARDSPDPPSADRSQLDRIESLLTEVLDRMDRIEARLDHPETH